MAALSRPTSAIPARGSESPMFDKSNHVFPTGKAEILSIHHGNNNETLSSDYRYQPRPSTALPSLGASHSAQSLSSNPFIRPSTAGGTGRPGTGGLGAFHLGSRTLESTSNLAQQQRPQTSSGIPRFVTTDKQICRFHAYVEVERPWDQSGPLGPSKIEPYLVRHMTILYYIYDDTIEITEAKETNSGMWQGIFLKRCKVNTSDEQRPVTLTDLQPGKQVPMLGLTFHITDADGFTREYFKREFQIILPPALRPQTASQRTLSRSFVPGRDQQDKSHVLGAQFSTGLGPSEATTLHRDRSHNTRSTDYLVTKEGLDKTYRFLKFEGQRLKYLCVEVRSRNPPYFPALDALFNDRKDNHAVNRHDQQRQQVHGFVASDNVKKYALTYFLETNYIDLCLNQKDAGAQDEPRLLLKKGPLPLNWRDPKRGNYEAADLRCGEVIDVYGRLFLLVDCDDNTKRYCRNEFGITHEPVLLMREEEHPVIQPIPILGDGFLPIGSNEDTLATVYGMPRVTKDTMKISRNQGRVLRAKAVLVSGGPIDLSRSFLVTFFLEDDTLQIYEENRRNSGINGGNFLKRGRYKNDAANHQQNSPDPTHDPLDPHAPHLMHSLSQEQQIAALTPKYFTAQDIHLGNILAVNDFLFQIVEMDNLSLKFCESYPDEFPLSNTFRIVADMMVHVLDRRIDLRPLFRRADPQNVGFLGQEAFILCLDSLGVADSLNDQELLTLIRRFQDKATVPARLPTNTGNNKFRAAPKHSMSAAAASAAISTPSPAHGHSHAHAHGTAVIHAAHNAHNKNNDVALILAALAGEGFGSAGHNKDENVFWYHEMCDLVSHLYFSQQVLTGQAHIPQGHGLQGTDALRAFFGLCRSRTVQWRRVLRKDPLSDSVVQGKVTLGSLIQIFQKHGIPAHLMNAIVPVVAEQYRVESAEERQILQHMEERHGADQSKRLLQNLGSDNKVARAGAKVSAHAAATQSLTQGTKKQQADKHAEMQANLNALLQKNSTYSSSTANRIAELRRLRNKMTSVLRNQHGLQNQLEQQQQQQLDEDDERAIIIDYHRLCDDIYVSDWI